MASKIGLAWPLAADYVTFERASLLYVPTKLTLGDGTVLPAQLAVAATVSIPAARITNLTGALVINGTDRLAIQARVCLEALKRPMTACLGTGIKIATRAAAQARIVNGASEKHCCAEQLSQASCG